MYLLGFALCAVAAKAALLPRAESEKDVAIFENSNNPLDPIVPDFNLIGNYQGLNWAFLLGGAGVTGTVDGIIPKSPTHVAAAVTGGPGTGQITVPPGSNIKSFDLSDFFYACVLGDGTNEVGAPEGCAISVTGRRADGTLVSSEAFNFAAPLLNQKLPMTKGTLTGFTNLVEAKFQVAVANIPVVPVLYVDNVKHTNWFK